MIAEWASDREAGPELSRKTVVRTSTCAAHTRPVGRQGCYGINRCHGGDIRHVIPDRLMSAKGQQQTLAEAARNVRF